MNWEDVYELDMGELAENPQHHPKCNDKEASLDGLTPNVTARGARISWTDELGHYGHHCFTGQGVKKAKGREAKAKQLADAIGRMRTGDDEEARETLIAMSNEELAHVVLGAGAQKLQAIKHLGELANVGVGTPEVDDPDECPIRRGQMDCPICGGRHQPTEVYMTDEAAAHLMQSLEVLDELT